MKNADMGSLMSSKPDVLIVAENLSKSYEIYERPADRLKQVFFGKPDRRYFREFHALSDVSFEIERGASLGVIGKNGAGKSTLLQLITGTLAPSTGTVKVFGKVAAVLELGAGFNAEFSGRENIELYCNLLQMSPDQIKARFEQIVDFSELEKFIDQPLKTYSSGMVARLAFSVIAHIDADILIVDEALSVGDASFSQKCMRFFRDFRQRGTIFFVSHDLSAVKAFCDQAIWLEGGQVRSYGDSRTVCEAYMADIYPNAASPEVVDGPVLTGNEDAESEASLGDSQSEPEIEDFVFDEIADWTEVLEGGQQIEAFSFNSDSSGFGDGGAEIASVLLRDTSGRDVAFCEGQKRVVLTVRVRANKTLHKPIVGFFVKDRLGQPLFGANTFLTYKNRPVSVVKGQVLNTHFVFRLPTLMVADYSITAAVADGTLESHTQLHWAHDAALFKVTASSMDGVLVGIPMEKVSMSYGAEDVN